MVVVRTDGNDDDDGNELFLSACGHSELAGGGVVGRKGISLTRADNSGYEEKSGASRVEDGRGQASRGEYRRETTR